MIEKQCTVSGAKLFLLLLGLTVVLSGCSELSLSSLLKGEERGAFAIVEREVHLQPAEEFTLTATGGFRPYVFILENGIGQLNSTSGHFVAPGTLNGEAIVDIPVTAVDFVGARTTALLRLYNRFSVHPRLFEVAAGGGTALVMEVSGGIGPYTFDLDDGAAMWTGDPGDAIQVLEYEPPGTPGLYEIQVRDGIGNQITARVTVYSADQLRIAPASTSVVLTGGPQTRGFDISGGIPPYNQPTHTPAGFGSLNWLVGSDEFSFTVNSAGSATITVTDSAGTAAHATVVVVSDAPQPLSMSPSSVTLQAGGSANFLVTGGIPPYAFEARPGAHSTLQQVSTNVVRFVLSDSLPPPFRNRTWEIVVTDAAGASVISNAHTVTP